MGWALSGGGGGGGGSCGGNNILTGLSPGSVLTRQSSQGRLARKSLDLGWE